MTKISERLRAIREYRRLSRAELARARGLNARLIARIESGKTKCPRQSTVNALADGLRVKVGELTGEIPFPPEVSAEFSDDRLIELGREMWQLCKSAQGWLEKLGGRHQRRAGNQIDWGRSRLTEILAQRGIELQDRTGQAWDEGDPVDIVNASEAARSDASIVTSTLEPVVLHQGKVVRRGKVIVATQHTGDPTQ